MVGPLESFSDSPCSSLRFDALTISSISSIVKPAKTLHRMKPDFHQFFHLILLVEKFVKNCTVNVKRDPFNQNFRKFRSKTEWIGSVQPGKFRKNWPTFRGAPLFSVGPVRSNWTVAFDHFDPFSIPGPRCLVSSMLKMEENTYHCTFTDC